MWTASRPIPNLAVLVISCFLFVIPAQALAQNATGFVAVVGTVRDLTGARLGGVKVEAVRGLALATGSDANGFYFIAAIETDGNGVTLKFSKSGFMRTLAALPVVGSGGGLLQKDAVLKAAGNSSTLDLSKPASATQDSTMLTIQPGDLVDANGSVLTGQATASLTTLDPSGLELDLFPGLDATQGGTAVLLESFGAVDIIVSAGGQPAAIAPGKTLTVEFPIADALQSQFTAGQTLDNFLWSLNESTGQWEGGLSVMVHPSSVTPGKNAFIAQITHLSTWNCDRPLITTCLQGKVVEKSTGTPLRSSRVSVRGVDFNGKSETVTNSSGHFCLATKRGGRVNLSAEAPGLPPVSITVTTQGSAATCAQGGCQDLGNIEIDALGRTSCVSGVVYSSLGLPPIPAAIVVSDQFTSTQTDASGNFCMAVTPNVDVKLTIAQFDIAAGGAKTTEVTAHTPGGPATCGSPSNCATVQVGKPIGPIDVNVNCGSCGVSAATGTLVSVMSILAVRRGRRRRRTRTMEHR